jgi:hypothetical protein
MLGAWTAKRSSMSAPSHPPLVAQDLDNMGCINPDCTGEHPVFLQSNCHPGKGVEAAYQGGVLEIACYVCHELIVRVEVSRAEVQ